LLAKVANALYLSLWTGSAAAAGQFGRDVSMPTRNVNLTDRFDDFIANEIASGRYRNASEVMRAGLRLLQEQSSADTHKLEMLRRLATVGLDQLEQGRGIEFSSSADLAVHIASLGASRPKRKARRRA